MQQNAKKPTDVYKVQDMQDKVLLQYGRTGQQINFMLQVYWFYFTDNFYTKVRISKMNYNKNDLSLWLEIKKWVTNLLLTASVWSTSVNINK